MKQKLAKKRSYVDTKSIVDMHHKIYSSVEQKSGSQSVSVGEGSYRYQMYVDADCVDGVIPAIT